MGERMVEGVGAHKEVIDIHRGVGSLVNVGGGGANLSQTFKGAVRTRDNLDAM